MKKLRKLLIGVLGLLAGGVGFAQTLNRVKESQLTSVSPFPSYTDQFVTPTSTNQVWGFNAAGQVVTYQLSTGFTVTGSYPNYTLTAAGGGGGVWGTITGTLSNQTDLQTALNGKQPLQANLTSLAAAGLPSVSGYVLSSTTGGTFSWVAAGSGGTTTNALTFNNGGSGAASGTAFNGSTAYTISYNTIGAQPLATNLTSLAGLTYVSPSFVKMTGANTFALDTNTYLTTNQSITLSGAVTGSGATAITTTLATAGAYTALANITGSTASPSAVSNLILGGAPVTDSNNPYRMGSIIATSANQGNLYTTFEIQGQNSGAAASTEFVANADNATSSTHYLTAGINSSTYAIGGTATYPFGADNTFLISGSDPIFIGTATSQGVTLFTNNIPFETATGAGAVAFPLLTSNGHLQTSGSNGAVTVDTTSYQTLSTNLTSLAGLTYVSASFVKMTAAGTFGLDTNTYLTASTGVTSVTGTANQITVTGTTTPTLSIPSAFVLPGTINGATITTTTSGTLTLANSSTLATSGAFSTTLSASATTTVTLPGTSSTMARTDALQTFTGVQTFSSNPTFSAMSTAGIVTNNSSGVLASLSNASSASSVLEGILGSGWSNSTSLFLRADGTWASAGGGSWGPGTTTAHDVASYSNTVGGSEDTGVANLVAGTDMSVTGSDASALGVLRVSNTYTSSTYLYSGSFLNPNITAGGEPLLAIGLNTSVTNNAAYIGFNYTSSGSASNYMGFGFNGNGNLMKLSTTGQLTAASEVLTGSLTALSLTGTASNGLQIAFGTTAFGAVGTQYSNSVMFLGANVLQTTSGSDSWTQQSGSFPSLLFNENFATPAFNWYYAASSTAAGNFATFWGAAKASLAASTGNWTAGTYNGLTVSTTTGTLTLVNGSTLQTTGAFTLNLTTTAASTPTFPTGTYTLAQITNGQTFAGTNTFATIVATTVENVAGTTLTLDSLTHTAAMTGTTVSGSYTGASVAQIGVGLTPTINQTGTSSFTALDVNSTNSAFGTGAQYLLNLRGAGNSVLNVGNLTYGALVTDTGFGLNMPAQTYTATGTSTVASMGLIHIGQATLTNAGVGTVTALATLLIDNAPAVAGSQVGTNKYALDVLAGTSIFNGLITMGAGVTASGAAANDWSGGTGTFKTSTGAVTIGTGAVTISGATTTSNTFTLNGTATATALTVAQTAQTSGVAPAMQITVGASTGITASTVAPVLQTVTATRTWATTGTVADQYEYHFVADTLASASASQTFTVASTVDISGPPVQGTNAILSNPLALDVEAGPSSFGGTAYTFSTNPAVTGATAIIVPAATTTFQTSPPATVSAVYLGIPTLADAAVSQTIATAATLTINGAPAAGTNITITNPWALNVVAGATNLQAATINGAATLFSTLTVSGSGAVNLGSGTTTVAALTTTGNVGIGISPSGSFSLYVSSNISSGAAAYFLQTNAGGYGVKITPGSDTNYALGITNAANSSINFSVVGSGNIYTAGTSTLTGNVTFGASLLSAGSLVLGTNGSTTALTLDTSQNATFAGQVISHDSTLHRTLTTLTNGAGSSAGTLANAPSVGNPTKWVPINDNGTTRYIPAW